MKDFISSLKFDTPLEPRHRFFVDEPMLFDYTKKFLKMRESTTWISYVCTRGRIGPVKSQSAHDPEILTSEALVDRSPTELFGMIKCETLPHSHLFNPLLPYP